MCHRNHYSTYSIRSNADCFQGLCRSFDESAMAETLVLGGKFGVLAMRHIANLGTSGAPFAGNQISRNTSLWKNSFASFDRQNLSRDVGIHWKRISNIKGLNFTTSSGESLRTLDYRLHAHIS